MRDVVSTDSTDIVRHAMALRDALVRGWEGGDQVEPAMGQLRQDRRARDGVGGTVDYQALARFRYEQRKFQAFSQSAAKHVGLPPR